MCVLSGGASTARHIPTHLCFHTITLSDLPLTCLPPLYSNNKETNIPHVPFPGTRPSPSPSAFSSADAASLGRDVRTIDWESGSGRVAWWSSGGGEGLGEGEGGMVITQ